jgi:hypothetical protein
VGGASSVVGVVFGGGADALAIVSILSALAVSSFPLVESLVAAEIR